jgi:glutaminase
LAGLSRAQFERVDLALEVRTYARGEVIARRGDPAAGLMLILSGEVSSTFTAPDGVRHRISTLSPGMSFGEMPLLAKTTFLLDFCADTTVSAAVMSVAEFDRLADSAPDVKLTRLTTLAPGAYVQMNSAIKSLVLFGIGRTAPDAEPDERSRVERRHRQHLGGLG